jgi:hypothetical protein
MAKLPGVADLGPAPRAEPARPVGSYDATGIARGAAAIGEAATQLGAGIQKAGAGLAETAQDEGRWQYAKAHSDFVSRKIDLDAAVGKDQNYGPDQAGKDLPTRYTEQLNAIRAQSSGMIQDPNMRGMFMDRTQPNFNEGVVQAQAHARALSNDAQTGYVSEMGDKAINQAVAAKDDATRTQIIDAHNQLIDGLSASGAISDVQARQMKQAWAHQYATADVLHRADTDPQGVINELRAAPGSADAVTNRIIAIEGEGKNGKSSATGVGQFTDGTWLDMIKRNRPDLADGRSDADILSLRADRGLARQMVGKLQDENAAALKGAGLPATPGNLYLAHFLGAGGAKAVLQAPPNMPVADALAKAVGPDKSRAMIDANPTILQGQLAGSVKQWADGKMGGAAPGGGSIYDMLRPDVREQLLAHAQTQLQKQTVQDLTGFKARIEDTQAEAQRTGNVTKPLTQGDFIGHLGADAGPKAYQTYQAGIQVARDVTRVATMDPAEMSDLVASYAPKPGAEGYAAAAERQDMVRKAVAQSLKERADDPAGFAVSRLPGTQEAYKGYSSVLANPVSSPGERAVAARSFAATTLLEQQGAGIPPGSRQILPAADVERVKAAFANATTSDDPKARVGLIGQVQAQKAMWGDYWPDVVRQLTPSLQPMVRAIAADADPAAMTRLLQLDPKENPKAVLKEQSETKASDLTKALNTEMTPLLQTMVGRQKDRDFFDYYNMADKLAALYVRDGKDATTAAHDAFTALIGGRYDFRDSYRIPKDSGVAADDVQAGALVAKQQLDKLGARPAVDDIGGLSSAASDSLSKFSRDGVWVTSPDNGGLNLMYGDKSVRDGRGQPLFLSWARLAQLGGTPETRAAAFSNALSEQPQIQ